jgi:hypothetical protein
MQKSALSKFQAEFRKWVLAYNSVKNVNCDPDTLLERLTDRIPEDRQIHIGAALLNGWIETEREPNHGYFVRESDRPGNRGVQPTITNYGNGNHSPWWELFVQLADYGWLRSIAEHYGQRVWLEDRLMDLTVSAGDRLILYVEHKEKSAFAEKLLDGMRYYGKTGFNLNDPDRGDDPLRKAKYLVRDRAHPKYFGLSAVGYRKLFKVEYADGNRFQLTEDDRGFGAPLSEYPGSPGVKAKAWSSVDPLASEIERLCPEIWISVGTGNTASNFYIPGPNGDAIIIGVYQNEEVWTDIAGIGPEMAEKLATELGKIVIDIDINKQCCFWLRDGVNIKLGDADPVSITGAVREVLDFKSL